MDFLQCEKARLEETIAFYTRVVKFLEATVNYPKWTDDHPGRDYVSRAVDNGEQYVYIENGRVVGAVILSEDPEGFYEAGEWKTSLHQGEFLVVHALASDPDRMHSGIGSFMVKQCVAAARRSGYKAIRLDVVPDNHPAARLYQKHGFTYAGTKDLCRNIPEIPVFDLYELNL